MPNILHVNFSKSGGAGTVASRLMGHQSSLTGYQSEFINHIETDLFNEYLKYPNLTIDSILDNYIIKRRDFVPLISLVRDKNIQEQISRKIFSHNGILHFHWMNGLLDFKTLEKVATANKPLVWTAHDMNIFTGTCHHSFDCKNYVHQCIKCPAVKSPFRSLVSKNAKRKHNLLKEYRNLICTFPSRWLEDKFNEVLELNSVKTQIVKNPISDKYFESRKNSLRRMLNIEESEIVFGFISAQLQNPLKRFDVALKALNEISRLEHKNVALITMGEISTIPQNRSGLKIIHLGRSQSDEDVISFYDSIDVHLSTSDAESFSLTVGEAASRSVPSVVKTGTAGQELITEGDFGVLFQNEEELVRVISMLIREKDFRNNLSRNAKRYAEKELKISKIAKRFDELYKEVDNK